MKAIVTDQTFLRKITEEVKEGEDISEIVSTLFNELKHSEEIRGVEAFGFAANQFGYSKRIFVMKLKPYSPICIVNPFITKERGSQVREEGCFSIPQTIKEPLVVKRPMQITVKGLNQYLKPVKYKLSGLQARVACHEVDHLNGKLIIDYKEE